MQTLNISFEFFPPKSTEGAKQLLQTASVLRDFQPDFFSVTFGAGGSTREGTVKTLLMLREETPIVIAPHLSCRGMTRQQLIEILHTYKRLGVRRLVVLRGDLSLDMSQTGELQYASELVALIREIHGQHFHIEVAAYPDIHPQALTVEADILNLKRKVDAGANSAITQYFYNTDAYFRLLDECEKKQITIPIIPGIMPILQYQRLLRFSENCGAEIPFWIRKRFESYQNDPLVSEQFGIEVISKLCEKLIANGIWSFHFYTLNQYALSAKILSVLKNRFSSPKKLNNERIKS